MLTGVVARIGCDGGGIVNELAPAVVVGLKGFCVLVGSTSHAVSSTKNPSNATAVDEKGLHDMPRFYQHWDIGMSSVGSG